MLVQLGSGVVVEVLMVGDEARDDFLESALGSGISSGMLQRPLICSNSCTCHAEGEREHFSCHDEGKRNAREAPSRRLAQTLPGGGSTIKVTGASQTETQRLLTEPRSRAG